MSKVSQFPPSDNAVQPAQVSDQKVQKETILEFIKVYGFDKTLTGTEQSQFIQTALAGDLNPFKREIHLAVYGEGENRRVSMLTGYQVYLKRAERTGNLDGWRAWLEGEGSQMKAVVEIFRKDWSHSFTHEVYWEESVQKKKDGSPTQFWSKQPRFQLRKVAIAQGFRLAFPDELGSLPYESAELPESENTNPAITTHDSGSAKSPNPGAVSDLATQALKAGTPPAQTTSLPNHPEQNAARTNAVGDSLTEKKEKAVQHIEELFENYPDDFTEKHRAWILDKVYKAPDKAGIEKMTAYTEKVVRTAASA